MKIATIATLCFAAGFATAIAPAQTTRSCIAPVHIQSAGQSAGWIDLDTDYLLTGPDLMLVSYDSGTLET